ncbi:MAG: hypothetical protein IKH71_03285, partial [Oscillospiraceae bacterium]|nr:hypothetical protein [Oscillospiraceae bacterium]
DGEKMLEFLIIIFLLFQNIILQYIPLPFLGYWDEACAILFASFFLIGIIKKKGVIDRIKGNIIFLLLACIIIVQMSI